MWTKALLFSLIVTVTTFPAAKAPSPYAIPLRTRSRQPIPETETIVPNFLTLFNNTLKKYNVGTHLATYPGLNTAISKHTTPEPLSSHCTPDNNDLLYYGPLQIRDNTFTIDFDTGSSDLFVPGLECGAGQGCPGAAKYDGLGKDLGNMTSVTYGSGQISGRNYLDTVAVGDLTAEGTNVIALSQAEGFGDGFSDGLMGMGFSTIANSNQPTFIEKLISADKLPSPEFCFYFGRCNENTGNNSEMTIGGRNPAKYSGNFTTVPVKTKDYWRVPIDGVKVGDLAVNLPGDAIIDTGTTAVVMSSQYAVLLNEAMGGIPVPLEGTGSIQLTAYAIPCRPTTPISFIFSATPLLLSPKDISLGLITLPIAKLLNHAPLIKKLEHQQRQRRQITEPLCISAILQADLGPTMNPPVASFNIIGDSFLKNWYSCYSYEGGASVGFAKAVG